MKDSALIEIAFEACPMKPKQQSRRAGIIGTHGVSGLLATHRADVIDA